MSATAELRQKIDEAVETWKENLAEERSIRELMKDNNSYGAGYSDGTIAAVKLMIRQLIEIRELAEASR